MCMYMWVCRQVHICVCVYISMNMYICIYMCVYIQVTLRAVPEIAVPSSPVPCSVFCKISFEKLLLQVIDPTTVSVRQGLEKD